MAKGKATTISIKAFDKLKEELDASNDESAKLKELVAQRVSERDKADQEAKHWQGAAEMWRDRFEAEQRRSSRAEGYAAALIDQQYPARPLLPWDGRPDEYDSPPIQAMRRY